MLTDRILFDPGMTEGGGGDSGSVLDVGGGDSAAETGETSGDGDAAADDYADLQGDDRVKAYIEKQYGHIPQEHRSPDGFKQLLGARDQVGSLQQQLQQLQRGGQQGQQNQETAQERAYHEAILDGVEKSTGIKLNPENKRFFGAMLDAVNKSQQEAGGKNFQQIQNYLVQQHLTQERSQARAMPGYRENEREIDAMVAQLGVPFAAAYKMVMFDKRQKGASQGGSGAAPATGTTVKAQSKTVSEGDRPSGATSGVPKMPKYKAGESRNGAAAALRQKGIRVG